MRYRNVFYNVMPCYVIAVIGALLSISMVLLLGVAL